VAYQRLDGFGLEGEEIEGAEEDEEEGQAIAKYAGAQCLELLATPGAEGG
jgi:hypothetical protein